MCVFERTCVGLVCGGSEHLGRGLQTSDDGGFRAQGWGMRGGSGSECGCKCPLGEGSGQPAGHRQGVLPLCRLSLRLPDGPRNVEQQVDTPDHFTCPTVRQSRWATPLKAASGKDLPRGRPRGSRTPRHPGSCVLVSRTVQQGGGWAITHPAPEEGPESRWHRAGLSVPRRGPLVHQYRHFPRTRPLAFSTEGFSLCGKDRL